jgi:hypothetical protein
LEGRLFTRRGFRIWRARGLPALAIALALGSAAALRCQRAPGADSGKRTGTAPANADPSSAKSEDYVFSPGEKTAVDAFLRRHPTLRVATDSDRAPLRDGERDMGRLYGLYHPYFVRGDVNDDGVLDFVLAFVQRKPRSPLRFSVVVFTGRAGAGGASDYQPGEFVERDVPLARGDVAVDRDAVLVTPDVSEDDVRRYRWSATERTYVLVDESDDEAVAPEMSET